MQLLAASQTTSSRAVVVRVVHGLRDYLKGKWSSIVDRLDRCRRVSGNERWQSIGWNVEWTLCYALVLVVHLVVRAAGRVWLQNVKHRIAFPTEGDSDRLQLPVRQSLRRDSCVWGSYRVTLSGYATCQRLV